MVTLDNGGSGRPSLRLVGPPAALSWAVEHGWVDRVAARPAPPPAGDSWRIVPDPSAHLVLVRHRGEPGYRGDAVRLVGPRTRHLDVDRSTRAFTVGVRLRPGVLPLLTRTPADEWLDRSTSLEAVLPARARALLSRVDAAPTPDGALDCLMAVLADRLTGERVDWRARAVSRLVDASAGRCSSDEVARATGAAPRTLRKALREHVGLGLKRFARLHRLHRALEMGLAAEPGTWASVAAQTGYADQAHLVREFRTLLGETPSGFLSRNAG